jgi:hypothetical protein
LLRLIREDNRSSLVLVFTESDLEPVFFGCLPFAPPKGVNGTGEGGFREEDCWLHRGLYIEGRGKWALAAILAGDLPIIQHRIRNYALWGIDPIGL